MKNSKSEAIRVRDRREPLRRLWSQAWSEWKPAYFREQTVHRTVLISCRSCFVIKLLSQFSCNGGKKSHIKETGHLCRNICCLKDPDR